MQLLALMIPIGLTFGTPGVNCRTPAGFAGDICCQATGVARRTPLPRALLCNAFGVTGRTGLKTVPPPAYDCL